jgi:prevent-host-death family protein
MPKRSVEIAEAHASLAEIAREARDGPIVLTEGGKPIAAVVPIEDTDLESLSLATNPDFIALIQRSRARHAAEGGTSSDEMRRRLGLKK